MRNSKAKPLRNPNGYGSVYKLSGRRRRPWVARITTGWTTTIAKKGKRAGQEVRKQLYQTIGYFSTRQEALDALVLHRISPVSPKQNITLKELYSEWSTSKYENISKHTANNYKTAWNYVKEYKNVKFKELRTAHWQAVIDQAAKKGLKLSALKKIRTVAAELNKYAMENDVVNKNYAQFIKLPKFEKAKKERFSDPEVKKIEDAAKGDPWVATVLILIYTGMRVGELLKLTLFNVDISRQLITGGAKTVAGKDRIIPFHPKIVTHIQQWYNRGGDALICRDDGSKMSPDYYRKNFYYEALEAAGVRRLVPHTCRHTFGSLAAEAGVDPLYIQKLIGHADYAFTANNYTHPEIEALRKAMSMIR